MFQDYDKTRCSHVTAEQFRRVLKVIGLMPPEEKQFQIMLRKYFDKGNVREINYIAFCADIDRPEDIFPDYTPKNPKEEPPMMHGQLRDAGSTYYKGSTAEVDVITNRFLQQRVEKANNPDDVEERLQAMVVMKRIRIEEFFQDYDKLRKGKVKES